MTNIEQNHIKDEIMIHSNEISVGLGRYNVEKLTFLILLQAYCLGLSNLIESLVKIFHFTTNWNVSNVNKLIHLN